MAFSFCVLGSGSLGNCTVVRLGRSPRQRHLLIDAGLSPRQTQRRLEPLAIDIRQLDAMLLTHLDADHFHRGWLAVIEALSIPVVLHRRHVPRAVRRGIPVARMRPFDGPFRPFGGTTIDGVVMAHDQWGTVGYRIEHDGHRLGYATDLGRVPPALVEAFAGVHVLAIESNYDRRLQLESDRPAFLRRRIMGGAGHLSNDQALEAILQINATASLERVILLHLSRECNHPRVVQDLYSRKARHLLERLTITDQREPTPVIEIARRPRIGQQMELLV